jgi:hypothetical protein
MCTRFRQAIREEERKKNKASEPVGVDGGLDELTIYLRTPTATPQAPTSRRLSQLSKRGAEDSETISDKIEIDSDNIETPPVTRRLFSPPKDVKLADKDTAKRERTTTTQPPATASTTSLATTPTTLTSLATPPGCDVGNSYTDLGSGNTNFRPLLARSICKLRFRPVQSSLATEMLNARVSSVSALRYTKRHVSQDARLS